MAAARQAVLLWVRASHTPSSLPSPLVELREGTLSSEGFIVKFSIRDAVLRMLHVQRKENPVQTGLGKKTLQFIGLCNKIVCLKETSEMRRKGGRGEAGIFCLGRTQKISQTRDI